MAYRSDVRIVVSNRGYRELETFVDLNLPKDVKNYNLLKSPDVKKQGSDQIYFGWDSVKWYEDTGFLEVETIMNGLNHLRDNEYSYNYARLGEEVSDYEEKYFEGDNDKDVSLEFPQLERYFDDDQFISIYDKGKDVEM